MQEDTFHLGIKALLRNNKGEILLLKVNPAKLNGGQKDYWDLPGGRVQKGSSVIETLRREVQEETGITEIHEIVALTMILSNIRIPLREGGDVGLILSVYTCGVAPDTPITLSQEHIASRWCSPTEAAELLRIKYPPEFTNRLKVL